MKVFRKIKIFVFVLLFASLANGQNIAGNISKNISEITSGANSIERGGKIRAELEKTGIKFTVEKFTAKARNGNTVSGENIIAEIPNPKATKTILLGAHYDRVSKGKGALDNASGSAAALELLKIFKANPLKNFSLKAAFWDMEEVGLVGSREYVRAQSETGLPLIYINFDVFGYGDTIWLWTENESTDFSKAVEETAKKENVKAVISKDYPPSDHLSFAQTKTETYSFSLLNKNEIEGILKVLKGEKVSAENFPRILLTIHTEEDTTEKIEPEAIAKALPAIEQAIRKLDK
jgi:Zn-dependent M28 family amino/carboxypeptidase